MKPIDVFDTAINNVKPDIEIQLPPRRRRRTTRSPWPSAANASSPSPSAGSSKPPAPRAASPCRNASPTTHRRFHKEGDAMTTRENVHKMAEANKAFAHFAF